MSDIEQLRETVCDLLAQLNSGEHPDTARMDAVIECVRNPDAPLALAFDAALDRCVAESRPFDRAAIDAAIQSALSNLQGSEREKEQP